MPGNAAPASHLADTVPVSFPTQFRQTPVHPNAEASTRTERPQTALIQEILPVHDRKWPLAWRARRDSNLNLQIRRYLCGRPGPFSTVRDLGLVSPGCPGGSGSSQGCSSAWLPAWLPAAPLRARLMVFKIVGGSRPAVAAACLVGTPGWLAKQDHPAYIPRLGCPGREPQSAGRDQYALKLESLIPALQPDYEPSICEWRHRLGDAPGLTGDADVDITLGVCGLRGDRCQRRHIGCGHGDEESGRAGGQAGGKETAAEVIVTGLPSWR